MRRDDHLIFEALKGLVVHIQDTIIDEREGTTQKGISEKAVVKRFDLKHAVYAFINKIYGDLTENKQGAYKATLEDVLFTKDYSVDKKTISFNISEFVGDGQQHSVVVKLLS